MTKRAVVNFSLRHITAGTAAWVLYPACVTVLDLVLFTIALVFNKDHGGPLFLPASIVVATAVGLFVTVLIAFPSVLVADLATRQERPPWLRVAIKVAIASVMAVALCGVYAALSGLLFHWPLNGAVRFTVLLGGMLPALCCYLTLTVAPQIIASVWRGALGRRFRIVS